MLQALVRLLEVLELEVQLRLHRGDLRPEMEQAYDRLKPGEMSDVVETPYSWHIIKLLARHPKTEDEDASVEIAHIMLEKVPLLPELTAEQAAKISGLPLEQVLELQKQITVQS